MTWLAKHRVLFAISAQAISLFAALIACALLCGQTLAQQTAPNEVRNRLELSLDESATPGTVLETLSARFDNLENFRVAGDAEERLFDVDQLSGAIVVREGAILDFESRSLHSLTIQADAKLSKDDQFLEQFAVAISDDGLSASQLETILPPERLISVRIRLRNVPEAPQMAAAVFSLPENSDEGQFVGQMSAIDPDGPARLRYSIVSDDITSPFAIDPTKGTLTVCQTERLDFEKTSEIAFTVRVTDQDGLAADSEVRVQLTDVDEPPSISIEATPLEGNGPALALDHGLIPLPVDVPSAGEPFASNPAPAAQQAESSLTNDVTPTTAATSSESRNTETALLPATAKASSSRPAVWIAAVLLLAIIAIGFTLPAIRKARQAKLDVSQNVVGRDANAASGAEGDGDCELAKGESISAPVAEAATTDIVKDQCQTKDLCSEDDLSTIQDMRDPESLFDDRFLSPPPEPTATEMGADQSRREDGQTIRLLQEQIDDRDATITYLKDKLEKLTQRVESLTGEFEDGRTLGDSRVSSHLAVEEREYGDGSGASWAPEPHRYVDEDECETHETAEGFDDTEPSCHSEAGDFNDDGVTGREDRLSFNHPSDFSDTDSDRRFDVGFAATTDASKLRQELAELFSIHSKPAVALAEPEADFDNETSEEEATDNSTEENHLDSVAQYLSELLERTKKEESAESIFADRRKTSAKWDGVDRRGQQKPKQPVKSYIETYLNEHGRLLMQDMEAIQAQPAVVAEPIVLKPLVRKPVDVKVCREQMNALREVSVRSAENALASYGLRQAKAKLVWRSVLVGGLIMIAVLAIGTNAANAFHFGSLNWAIGAIILLSIAELFLRIQSIRKRRTELRLRILKPIRGSKSRKPVEASVPGDSAIAEQSIIAELISSTDPGDAIALSML